MVGYLFALCTRYFGFSNARMDCDLKCYIFLQLRVQKMVSSSPL